MPIIKVHALLQHCGPVNALDRYCLPPLLRFNLTQILGLIEQKKYLVPHVLRQTGKASCLLALMAVRAGIE